MCDETWQGQLEVGMIYCKSVWLFTHTVTWLRMFEIMKLLAVMEVKELRYWSTKHLSSLDINVAEKRICYFIF